MESHPLKGRYLIRPPTLPNVGFGTAQERSANQDYRKSDDRKQILEQSNLIVDSESFHAECFADASDGSSVEEYSSAMSEANSASNKTVFLEKTTHVSRRKHSGRRCNSGSDKTDCAAGSLPKQVNNDIMQSPSRAWGAENRQEKTEHTAHGDAVGGERTIFESKVVQRSSRSLISNQILNIKVIQFISTVLRMIYSAAAALAFYTFLRVQKLLGQEHLSGLLTNGDEYDFDACSRCLNGNNGGDGMSRRDRDSLAEHPCKTKGSGHNAHSDDVEKLSRYNELILAIGSSAKHELLEQQALFSDQSSTVLSFSGENSAQLSDKDTRDTDENGQSEQSVLDITTSNLPSTASSVRLLDIDDATPVDSLEEYTERENNSSETKTQLREDSTQSEKHEDVSCRYLDGSEATKAALKLRRSTDASAHDGRQAVGELNQAEMLHADDVRMNKINVKLSSGDDECLQFSPGASPKLSRRGFRFDAKNIVKNLRLRRRGNECVSMSSPRSISTTLAVILETLVKDFGCSFCVKGREKRRVLVEKSFDNGTLLRIRIDLRPVSDVSSSISFRQMWEGQNPASLDTFSSFVNDFQQVYMYKITSKQAQ